MALSKPQIGSVEESYSFDERICDDLCEVILKYLPFESKLKLESVSNQFQRCLFGNHFYLAIDFNQFKSKTIQKIIERFGPKLIRTAVMSLDSKIMLPSLTDVEELRNVYLSDVCNYQLNRLKKLSIIYRSKDSSSLKKFVDKCKNVRHLSISAKYCGLKEFKKMFEKLIEIKDLVHFEVLFDESDDTEDIDSSIETIDHLNYDVYGSFLGFGLDIDLIRKMAQKCPNLKSFGGYFTICQKNTAEKFVQLLAPLKTLKCLKRLNLELRYKDYDSHWFPLSTLEGFTGITHFELGLHGSNLFKEFEISEQLVKQITEFMPKLELLIHKNIGFVFQRMPFFSFKKIETETIRIINKDNKSEQFRKFSSKTKAFLCLDIPYLLDSDSD